MVQHQLYNLDMNKGDSVHDLLTKVKVVRDQLATIGHKVDSAQLALMVLHKLLKSYKGVVMTATVGERSKLMAFEEHGSLLLQEEACESLYNWSEEKALTIKDKSKGKPKDSQSK